MDLARRMEELGRSLGEREAAHAAARQAARERAEELRADVEQALQHFHTGVRDTGAPHIELRVSPVRIDDKHLRSFEFELLRGRHRAILTVKSRGEVTLVGPFRAGKAEGPCRSFPLAASEEFDRALADFLAAFAEDATTP